MAEAREGLFPFTTFVGIAWHVVICCQPALTAGACLLLWHRCVLGVKAAILSQGFRVSFLNPIPYASALYSSKSALRTR
jgi:hypothetical protein